MLHPLEIQTECGVFLAVFSQSGLCQLHFPGPRTDRRISRRATGTISAEWKQLTQSALIRLLSGRHAEKLPPLDLSEGTTFQQTVWKALRTIPWGQTTTYGDVARQIRCLGGARAVGQACGRNPIPILVPCHRVLATNGKLGGFSAGLKWKQRLLSREQT